MSCLSCVQLPRGLNPLGKVTVKGCHGGPTRRCTVSHVNIRRKSSSPGWVLNAQYVPSTNSSADGQFFSLNRQRPRESSTYNNIKTTSRRTCFVRRNWHRCCNRSSNWPRVHPLKGRIRQWFLGWILEANVGARVNTTKSTPRQGTNSDSLLRFVDDLDGSHLCVIYLRREGEQQFSLSIGMQTMKFANHRLERPRGNPNDIEILKQHDCHCR